MSHSSWPDRLKWAEEQGLKNLQEKCATADNMNKEAQTTLTYVLAGMGSTSAYLFTNLDKPTSPVLVAAAILCAYFIGLGVYLVRCTFFIGDFPSPYQRPKNLLLGPHAPLDDVREGELENIDERIDQAIAWIERKSKVVNRVRAALVTSPIVGALAIGLYKAVG